MTRRSSRPRRRQERRRRALLSEVRPPSARSGGRDRPVRQRAPASRHEGGPSDPGAAGVDATSAVAERPVSAWNVANALTVLRVLLVPVFGWLLLYDGGTRPGYRLAAAGVFVLANVTDRIDGDIARARGLVTDFGKVSDPIADKALMGMAFVGLSVLGELSWWVTGLLLARELGITVVRFVVIRHGVIPASRGGKVKTVLQAVGAGLLVLPLAGGWRTVAVVVMALAVVVTVVTGVDYLVRAHRLRRTSPRAMAKRARRDAAAAARAEVVRSILGDPSQRARRAVRAGRSGLASERPGHPGRTGEGPAAVPSSAGMTRAAPPRARPRGPDPATAAESGGRRHA